MIPISDATRRPVRFPIISVLIITANTVMFLLELSGGNAFILRWSLIPREIASGHRWITLLTAMFMHAGWLHILGNMVFFWVFGPEIEDAMGPARFLVFYLVGGLIASAAQIAAAPNSTVPNLGASGAIAAVMGAFLITYPRDRIRTVLFIGWFIDVAVLPAALLVGIWILLQIFMEVGSLAQVQTGGIAYMAHIGGFLYGMIFSPFFERLRQ
jgi:membrane associated rhomboid family serine protease